MNYSVLLLICMLFCVSTAQSSSPTPSPINATIPDQATLRPTTSVHTASPTMTAMMERLSSKETSGEPGRGIVAGIAVAYCAIISSLGVWVISSEERDCGGAERRGGPAFSKVSINYDN